MTRDQRSFFRIDTMMPCSYRILSKEEAEAHPLPSSPTTSYIEKYFLDNLAELEEQITTAINQIGSKSSIVASVLTAMNSKINFFLNTLDESQLTHSIPQRLVNISAGGISLEVCEPVNPTDYLDILIKPLKDEGPSLIRSKVVKITPKDGSYLVALEFDKITEDDRRKIVYFIQNKEIEAANKARAEREEQDKLANSEQDTE